jgi:Spherulation-specific family 4
MAHKAVAPARRARRRLWTAVAIAVPLVVAAIVLSRAHWGGRTVDQLIPLYDSADPSAWATACSQVNGAGGGSYIIADVDGGQGPGSAPTPAWQKVIDDCGRYGRASVLGYVWTDYGQGGMASLASLEAQVRSWYSFYPGKIGGIFFDGASDTVPQTGVSNESFYRRLAAYVHEKQGIDDKVVLNYGANPASGWMFDSRGPGNADIVVTFEGSYDTPGKNPYKQWTAASWESNYAARHFAAIVYGAPATASTPQPSSACRSLMKQHIGYVYVGTTYSQLPPYFSAYVNDC